MFIFYSCFTAVVFGSIFTSTYLNMHVLEKKNSDLIAKNSELQKEILTTTNALSNLKKLDFTLGKLIPLQRFQTHTELQQKLKTMIKSQNLHTRLSIPENISQLKNYNSVTAQLTFTNTATAIRNAIYQLARWENCLHVSYLSIKGGDNNQHKCVVKCLLVMGEDKQ